MKPGAGKRKGSSFERYVCKELSLWISKGAREDVFWRSAMSGGRATVALRGGSRLGAQAGDLSPISALGERLLGHLVVECKHYRDLQLFTGVASDTGNLCKFWHELKKHAAKFGKHPMLIARQNLMPSVCLLEPETAAYLFKLDSGHASAILPRWGCWVVLLDCFLREAAIPAAELAVMNRARRVIGGKKFFL